MMALVTMYSMNLHGTLVSDTGLQLAGLYCSPFLKTGVTWASFQSDGTMLVLMEDWSNAVRIGATVVANSEDSGADGIGSTGFVGLQFLEKFPHPLC